MEVKESSVNNSTQELINKWFKEKRHVADLEAKLEAAKVFAQEAEENLAKRLLPDDAKPGEMFCIWGRDEHQVERLFMTTAWSTGPARVCVRS